MRSLAPGRSPSAAWSVVTAPNCKPPDESLSRTPNPEIINKCLIDLQIILRFGRSLAKCKSTDLKAQLTL